MVVVVDNTVVVRELVMGESANWGCACQVDPLDICRASQTARGRAGESCCEGVRVCTGF